MPLPTPTDPIALRSATRTHRPVARRVRLVCVFGLGLIAGCEQPREAWSPRLNDTGITECGDAYANGLPCADAAAGTQAFPGQDAERGRDVDAALEADGRAGFRFTKLDAQGRPLTV